MPWPSGIECGDAEKSAKAMQKTLCDTAPSTQECATVISGCHVKWATTTVLNKGYIMEASWDSSVERHASDYDNGAAHSAQEFTLLNMSSMMALLMKVVYHFKHESLSSQLISAFSTIDVDEIYALSATENASQCKYAIAVRDPRIHLPDWLAKSARVAALAKNIKLTDLQAWKAETTFEMLSNYAMVNQRVRFLKGFDDTALEDLNSQLFSVMGEKGIAVHSVARRTLSRFLHGVTAREVKSFSAEWLALQPKGISSTGSPSPTSH